jgi:hypothetical protein
VAGEPPPWEFPPAFYEGVGRVVMAAASLDVVLAMLAGTLDSSIGGSWRSLPAQPGGALKELRRITGQLPRGDHYLPLRDVVAEAADALNERHRIAHSPYMECWSASAPTRCAGRASIRAPEQTYRYPPSRSWPRSHSR